MSEEQWSAFLDRFLTDGRTIGLAVMGGLFSEGIDLPGDRLIGVIAATLGLPQVNQVNEQILLWMKLLFGDRAWDYTYLIPGMQKVVQPSGRVIRTRQDRGVLYLVDDRHGCLPVRQLLPAWWSLELPFTR